MAGSERRSHSLGQIIFQNTIATVLGGAIMKVLNVLFMIFVARQLSDSGLGNYATIVAFVGLFSPLFELGMSQYVQRTIAQQPDRSAKLLWNLAALRMILALVACLMLSAAALLRGFPADMVFGTQLYAVTFLFAAIQVPLETLLSANERFDLVTIQQIVGTLISMAVSCILLLAGIGFLSLIYAGFVALPIQIGMMALMIRQQQYPIRPVRVSPGDWPAFIRASLPFGVISLALMFNFNADTVILGYYFASDEVGAYNAAYRLVFSLVGVAGAFLAVITPSLARVHIEDAEHVRRWTRSSVAAMALIGLPLTVGVSLLAGPVVELLYGEALTASVPMLAWIVWDVPLILFTALCGNVTSAVGLERGAARINVIGAVLNVALNLALIPLLGGVGAAIVTLMTDGVSVVLFYWLLHDQFQLQTLWANIAKIVIAAAVMGGGVWLLLQIAAPLAVCIAAGIALYAMIVVFFRLIDPVALYAASMRLLRRTG
jgi:O-antigen/teichoic acid export membrane protein